MTEPIPNGPVAPPAPIQATLFNSAGCAPGTDPYLLWANETDLRDFAVDAKHFAYVNLQVAAQCKKVNPFKIDEDDDAWPHQGLREICKSNDGETLILTGMITQDKLSDLVAKCDLVELNVPRYEVSNASSGGAAEAATSSALSKRVMAVIDFGCPFAHRQFWDSWNDTTRVRYFWDQDAKRTIRYKSDKTDQNTAQKNKYWFINKKFRYGRETTSEELKPLFRRCMHGGVVDEDMAYELADYTEMQLPTSHGAHVLDLAAGRINPMSGKEDEASEADIIFVQLPRSSVDDTSGGSMTMYVLDALKYIFDKAKTAEHLVINMSFGSTAGPHDGTSLLERGIDMLIAQERKERSGRSIELVLPAGNHFLADLHGAVTLTSAARSGTFQWEIMPDDTTENYLELWCAAGTDLRVDLKSPAGEVLELNHGEPRSFDGAKACGLVRATGSACGAGEVVLVVLAPTSFNNATRVPSGVWSIKVTANITDASQVVVDAWVERDDPMPWQSGQPQCRLLTSSVGRDIDQKDEENDVVKRARTGNSLAYGKQPIVVGGYVVHSASTSRQSDVVLSAFSAAGNLAGEGAGVRAYIAPSDESDALDGIWAASNRSDTLAKMNGTSVAAPQVARQLLNSPEKRRIRYPASSHPLGDMRDLRGITLPRVF